MVTVVLIAAMAYIDDDEVASTEPGGEAFDLRDDIAAKLPDPVFVTAYIAEARDGDILTQAALWELYRAEQALRDADAANQLAPDDLPSRPYLVESFDTNSNAPFVGVIGLPDAVDRMLRLHPALNTSLAEATTDQVKLALHILFTSPLTSELANQLSTQAERESRTVLGQRIDYWTSPALFLIVIADNDALGGGLNQTGLSADETVLNKERFARNAQRILRGEQEAYRLWGIAIDSFLEAEEEGTTARIYVLLTVIAVLAVVGIALRSYWATALTAVGIAMLIVWLKGIVALVGLKGGLINDFLVPIAMVSLGVDFAVHAVRRYREERSHGAMPGPALTFAFAGVLGALTLAALSDGIAFLSNVPSGIEAVTHFGLTAAIAVVSAYVVLGIIVPTALMSIERLGPGAQRAPGRRAATLAACAGAGAAAAAGASVITTLALSEMVGAGLLIATAVGFIALPWLLASTRRTPASAAASIAPQPALPVGDGMLPRLVVGLAKQRVAVLVVAGMLTVASVFGALRLEASLDVKDFLASDSDFVVSLDKVDEHLGTRSGEGGVVYIQGDLTDPTAVAAVTAFVHSLSQNPYVGKEAGGQPSVFDSNLLDLLARAAGTKAAKRAIAASTGVAITDADSNGVPDTREQLAATYAYATEHGLPSDEGILVYRPDEVRRLLYYHPASGEEHVATLTVGIPGTREQATVAAAGDAIRADLAALAAHPSLSRIGLTGSPFTREAELSATTRTLRTSLPIAAAAALILLALVFRSLRFAVVTVVPIGLVVAWLYGIMYLGGFALNFVTATIGAVSIGVGIDYSIHMTARFREELRRSNTNEEALRRASSGTGTALLASAGSSIVGFAIMGFAPMPVLSTYGILTALMIFLALSAALLVLPPLLTLVAPPRPPLDGVTPRKG